MDNIHASALLYQRFGLLITGPSGTGKTSLTRALLRVAKDRSQFARLVSDDQVFIAAHNGRLLAHAPSSIAGMIEIFGLGITPMAHEPVAQIHGVIDLTLGQVERAPDDRALRQVLCGVPLPWLRTSLRHDTPDLVDHFIALHVNAGCPDPLSVTA